MTGSLPRAARGVALGATLALVGSTTLVACSSDSTESEETSTAVDAGLVFASDDYTEETTTVSTADGDVEVTYRYYAATPYVANPVDTDYQSLTVKVPVEIDGEAVDAADAPIILNITVGGYLSAAVDGAAGGEMAGAPDGELTPPDGESGQAPTDLPEGGAPGNGAQPGFEGQSGSGNAELALAAGYVVVTPAVRGRDNVAEDGTYYGKAPAAIVDLKAAVRYLRANDAEMAGNAEQIISTGTSAGGGLSALLAASGDSDLYDDALAELGAADASDAIFAAAAYCPITDLENANGAYEWMFGALSSDAEMSAELASQFAEYQESLGLTGSDGAITADNYGEYLLATYLEPAATQYLAALSDSERESYLSENSWVTWADGTATFTWDDFLAHVGRSKSVPAFDAIDLTNATGENILFGTETEDARHFTDWALQQDSGDSSATIDADLAQTVAMMNPMTFLTGAEESTGVEHYFLRVGTSDTDTTLTVLSNLAAAAAADGAEVDSLMYWDAGHGANEDADAFIAWVAQTTGYTG